MSLPEPGLCARCAWQRVVRNTRGSTFSLCERSKVDDRFAKYPRLPVLTCPGYAPRTPADHPGGERVAG